MAALAGVSFQTASKVLNGQTGAASAATHERIVSAARQLDYVPNALARGLVRQSALTVGILAEDFADLALSQFVVAAQHSAESHGHGTLIVTARPGSDPAALVRRLLEHRVNGILAIAPSFEDDPRFGAALRGPLPAVSISHVPGGRVCVVGSDHEISGALAAEHLVGLGHRRIAMVTGRRGRRVVASRSRGFGAALRAAGVRLDPRRVAPADWTPAGAYAATRQLLDAAAAPTAIFVHSDLMAMGVLSALRDRGVRVPADCSVVGCDDLPVASYLVPPLTTVHVPFQETGTRAAELLLGRIRGETIPRRDLLPVHLVVRASTAAPPAPDRSHPASRRRPHPVSGRPS